MTKIRSWRWPSTFSSLKIPNYRWLWLEGLAASGGFQMNIVVQGWLVYQLTGSAFALAWVSAGRSITMLVLSLYGGALCDRMEKRDMILWARAAMVLNYLLLATLVTAGAIRVWHLAASSLFTGILYSFIMPAQQALLAELVDRSMLLNAVSIRSIGSGIVGILASSIAGLTIARLGPGGVYFVMALLHLSALFAMTRLPATNRGGPITSSVWSDLREGLAYIRPRPTILALLGLVLVRIMFARAYCTLMPKYASDILGVDATGLGILMAAPGVGSLTASLVVASLGDFRGKGKLLLGSGAALGLFLILFANVHNYALVLVFLALVGAMVNICMVTDRTLIQANCEDEFRGRVTSMYVTTAGLRPLGIIPSGALADYQGVSFVVTLQGGIIATAFLATLLFKPKIRKLE